MVKPVIPITVPGRVHKAGRSKFYGIEVVNNKNGTFANLHINGAPSQSIEVDTGTTVSKAMVLFAAMLRVDEANGEST